MLLQVAEEVSAVEDECVFLEQIGSSRDDVSTWVQGQVEALERCLENPAESANIPAVLNKYKVSVNTGVYLEVC